MEVMEKLLIVEKELAITQLERAEMARQWQCARLEVQRLADKLLQNERKVP